ncbi:MAG TPA: hypothetical protein VHE30_18505 [Polyangiaceae bacterium]|nr:hypothetical protein [Polyangiaceae bacterium]
MSTWKSVTARGTLGALAAAALFSGTACNAILGIDEGHLVAAETGGSGNGGSGTGGDSDVDASSGGAPEDSGAGGASAGGKGGAGGGTGGATGGGGGAGGAAGGGGSGGSSPTEPPGVAGEVHCGSASCKLSSQSCCVDNGTFAAHCSSSCDSTSQSKYACDGSEDCGSGQHCCLAFGTTTATCAATCPAGSRVFCGADADCKPGQYCAPGSGAFATVFVCTDGPKAHAVWCGGTPCDTSGGKGCCYNKTAQTFSCAASCTGNFARFTCDGDDDCAAGEACCDTHTGAGAITGSACVTGSCAAGTKAVECGDTVSCTTAGSACCTSGLGTACSPTGTCSPGESVVCGTDADCTAGSCQPVTSGAIGDSTGRAICTP